MIIFNYLGLNSSHIKAFSKWYSSDVISAVLPHETIDFTGFSGTFQDIAVANKLYSYHI